MKKLYGVILIIFALSGCDSRPNVEWKKFDETALKTAQSSGHPTLIYFYAAWCRPCQQLRSSTFRDERVVNALSKWNRLKADMSFREDKTTIARNQAFEVWALPTLVFYGNDGKIKSKMQGYVSAERLLEVVSEAINS
ncbi:MAG TPA: thioredoxin fold domain-containing protein [Candidatus Omnitrophota bacterium]|nr:thioredoxin fold domain-containing protein [Candidatus Omnitrophota bacterium]